MHIPSHRVYKEMHSEAASIWYVPTASGDKTAILVKAPSNTLKAITQGCKVELIFGQYVNADITYLITGICIHDTADVPLIVFGLQRCEEEHFALSDCLQAGRSPIFFFSEMDICVFSSSLIVDKENTLKAEQFIGDIKQLYVGEFHDEFNKYLDIFQMSFDPTIEIPESEAIQPFQSRQRLKNALPLQ